MRKLTVFYPSFCEYCGKDRIVSLMPMYHGFAWYCFPCQLRYMAKTLGRRHSIADNLRRAREQREEVEV